MKTFYPCLACLAIIQFFVIHTGSAQSAKPPVGALQAPPKNIVIDGETKEWGDSLRYYNPQMKINFSLANSKDTLYMAIRINDRSEQRRILKAGLTFSIDPKGKKKGVYSITFPVSVLGSLQAPDLRQEEGGDITQADRDELMRERITTMRGIKVVGFKDIEGDMITTSNTYGFQTAVNYDEKGYLICEAAIPLRFFNDADISKNEWSFNFKINGLQRKTPGEGEEKEAGRSGRGGGRGGRGGGMHGESHTIAFGDEGHDALYKSDDFWEKFYLAK